MLLFTGFIGIPAHQSEIFQIFAGDIPYAAVV